MYRQHLVQKHAPLIANDNRNRAKRQIKRNLSAFRYNLICNYLCCGSDDRTREMGSFAALVVGRTAAGQWIITEPVIRSPVLTRNQSWTLKAVYYPHP
jgi:hypothetical protein